MKIIAEKIKFFAFGVICTTIFFGSGYIFLKGRHVPPELATSDHSLRHENPLFPHINPLIECNPLVSISNGKINTIQAMLKKEINTYISWGNVNLVSVYFRDLNNGPWFGIDDDVGFIPGSLLKVPFMIAIYKIAETDPTFLNMKITYHADVKNMPYTEYFRPPETLEEGKSYTVDELVKRMIMYSDNDAALTLLKIVDQSKVNDVYEELGIAEPTDAGYEMNVRTYASFFRILYNATYLSQLYSEKALDILDQSTFSIGIVDGVSSNVKVANKFGERWQPDTKEKQLHDCGIVYLKDTPYILCVMTRGSNFDKLANVISGISKIVFDSVRKE